MLRERLLILLEGGAELSPLEGEEAEKLMQAAHEVCPYSKATRGNIDVKLSVES